MACSVVMGISCEMFAGSLGRPLPRASLMTQSRGGHSRYILVGVCRSTSKKVGLRHGHNPKKGGLRHGYNPKKGGLRHGHEWKKGVLGTGTSRKMGKKDNLSN